MTETSFELHIFVIDDDPAFFQLLKRRVLAGFAEAELTHVGSLTEARELLKNDPPDFHLVIIDQHLPDGEGSDFLKEGWFENLAVLSMSSDSAPEIPGESLRSGATFFLGKDQISAPLFLPLLKGVIDRNRIQKELEASRVNEARMETIQQLIGTLKHEINNPLGAVLGGAYLLKNSTDTAEVSQETLDIVKRSAERIHHVLEQLSEEAANLQLVKKGDSEIFHVPGDEDWD